MIGTLIGLLLLCLFLGVIWWAFQQLVRLIPLAEPFATMVRVVFVLIMFCIVIYFVIVLLGMAGIHVAMPKLN